VAVSIHGSRDVFSVLAVKELRSGSMQAHLTHSELIVTLLIATYFGAIGAVLAVAYVAARGA
jgi:hypothetical protein